MRNYYEILDITVEASEAEIKKAYFKLVKKYPPDRYEQEFMKIREAYEILSNLRTRQQYDSMHKLDPIIKKNYENAKVLIEEDEFDKAIKVLEETVNIAPELSVVRVLLGETYRRNNNNGKAIKIFQGLFIEEPSNASFAGHLAYSFLERGWHKKAIDAFLNAIKLDIDNLSFYLGLSEAYMRNNDARASKDILKQAVGRLKEANEDNTAIYYQLIASDIMLNELVDMEKHLDALIILASKNEDIKDNIAWTLAQLAKQLIFLELMDEAKSIIKRASELLPEDKEILAIENQIENMGSIMESFEVLTKDMSVDENIKNLIEILIYYDIENPMGELEKGAILYSLKLVILNDFEFFKKDIRILREKYTELYNLKKEFFDDATNVIKRIKMIKELKKQEYKYAAVMAMFNEGEDEEIDETLDVIEEPYVREEIKIGRNDPCACGSGKKYKKCCGK